MRRARSWLVQFVSCTFIRVLMIFFIGVITTLAWQSYSDAGREAVANWCRSIAPQAASVTQNISSPPVAQNISPSPENRMHTPPDPLKATSDLLKATSLALAAVREGVDKLAAELTKLQTADRGPPEGASLASGVPPASRPPSAPSRAPPVR